MANARNVPLSELEAWAIEDMIRHTWTDEGKPIGRGLLLKMFALIREFERRTGTGAVLNTSFNLHGEPVVASAADAVDTFERSGLPHVAIGHWLISKK